MTTRSLTLHHQTRIAVNVIIEDDTGLLAFSIFFATRLFTLFWQANRFVSVVRAELTAVTDDLTAALIFTDKVLVITLNALAFGLGIKS